MRRVVSFLESEAPTCWGGSQPGKPQILIFSWGPPNIICSEKTKNQEKKQQQNKNKQRPRPPRGCILGASEPRATRSAELGARIDPLRPGAGALGATPGWDLRSDRGLGTQKHPAGFGLMLRSRFFLWETGLFSFLLSRFFWGGCQKLEGPFVFFFDPKQAGGLPKETHTRTHIQSFRLG